MLQVAHITGGATGAARPVARSKTSLISDRKSWPITVESKAPDGPREELIITSVSNWGSMESLEPQAALEGNSAQVSQALEAEELNVMDSRIWSATPEDVIEKVLAWLPLASVLCFRCVCKRWNTLVLSGNFVTSHSKSSPRRPCFLLCTVGQLACSFDPSLSKWLTLLKPASPGVSVIASTGSLFCLGNQVAECRTLSVCNPITRCLKHLPQMPRVRLIHKVTMIADRSSNSYKIMVSGEDGLPTPSHHTFNLMTEVYDSSTNTWRMASNPLPEAKFGSDPGVWCAGSFYCLTELPYGVVMFEPLSGEWSEIDASMPSSVNIPSLLTLPKNRLLMVGRSVTNHPHNRSKTRAICIWELQQIDHRRAWVELLRMPLEVCSKFLAPLASYSPFVCAGVGNSIFMTTHQSPEVLVYDIATDFWRWLPSDPLFPNNRDFHLLGFAFEPRFDAHP